MDDVNLTTRNPDESLVWRLVDKLDEQRRYPRVPLNAKAAARNTRGDKCTVRVTNISPDGLQLRCDVEAARLLHPAGGHIHADNAPECSLAFRLLLADGAHTLAVRCRLLYLTTVDSEPRCVVGLRFEALDAESERAVMQFFRDQLELSATIGP